MYQQSDGIWSAGKKKVLKYWTNIVNSAKAIQFSTFCEHNVTLKRSSLYGASGAVILVISQKQVAKRTLTSWSWCFSNSFLVTAVRHGWIASITDDPGDCSIPCRHSAACCSKISINSTPKSYISKKGRILSKYVIISRQYCNTVTAPCNPVVGRKVRQLISEQYCSLWPCARIESNQTLTSEQLNFFHHWCKATYFLWKYRRSIF